MSDAPSNDSGDRDPAGGLTAAEILARRLDRPMGVLGLVFLFVVLGQLLATDPGLVLALTVAGWVFWAVFVAEFLLRAYIARFSSAFWRKNWWQVIFLLVPFLRFVRAFQAVRLLRLARVARVGGILSAGTRLAVGGEAALKQNRLDGRSHRRRDPCNQPATLLNRHALGVRRRPV